MEPENTVQPQEALTFDNALNLLDSLVESYKSQVYIPSQKSKVEIKEINAFQQKEIYSSVVDNSLYNTGFVNVIYDILKTSFGEEKLKDFTVYDKVCIALAIRNQISQKAYIQFEENKEEKSEVDISSVIKKFEDYIHPKPCKFKTKDLVVSVQVPSIFLEKKYEEEIHHKAKTVDDVRSTKDIKELVSKEFLGELSKFITSVKIEKTSISFDSLTFNQRIKLVEKLPSSIIKEILDKITEWKKEIDEILTVKNEEGKSYIIKIDPVLFLN